LTEGESGTGGVQAQLELAARAALARAHAPYSGFPVGAALATVEGPIVPGCNVENASLGLGLCAERVALFGALARGWHPGSRMVIVTQAAEPTPPCGACRQALRELAPGIQIVSLGRNGSRAAWPIERLLPVVASGSAPDDLDPRPLIARKRDGGELSTAEIRSLVRGLVDGQVEEHQMSAFMMATYLKGMSARETRDLTEAMADSGGRLELADLPGPRIDKHSTGGVGDKLSLPLLPLALAAGLRVPMISGRGLGHTGGTLDKLEAIPGYRTELPVGRLRELARDPGGFIAGQTLELVPADRIMYALRDVSATVASVPLIVSSILSKKLSAGLTGLVLDVKYGRGAFMPDAAAAETLARALVAVARSLGLPAVALLTVMDEPIGRAVGNALEVRESFEVLTGAGTAADLDELTLALGGLMLAIAGRAPTMGDGARSIDALRRSGAARSAARSWIAAQGGDARVVDEPERIPVSPVRRDVRATTTGFVAAIDALEAGALCVRLGGGRHRAGDAIDRGVGIVFRRKRGERVAVGETLFTLYLPAGASPDAPVEGEMRLVRIESAPPSPQTRIGALVTADGVFADAWNAPLGGLPGV
jgi:pyrimidine-nucleoside phosphorylase/thymidine phosphorylase